MHSETIGNDNVTSATVELSGTQKCIPNAKSASVFVHENFRGPCKHLEPGRYPRHDDLGLPKDSISSIAIGQQAQVCACAQEQFRRYCATIQTSSKTLHEFLKSVGGANDKIRSIKVQTKGEVCADEGGAAQPAPIGPKKVLVFNCATERVPLQVWVRNITSNQPFRNITKIRSLWVNGSCPRNATGWHYELQSGIRYEFRFVNPSGRNCDNGNDPVELGCRKASLTISGGTTAETYVKRID